MNKAIRNSLRTAALAVVAGTLCLAPGRASAQPAGPFGGMDAQQIQQMIRERVMEFFRTQMGVTNDQEWGVIEKRLTKVVQAKAQELMPAGMPGGMGGPFGGGMGGPGGGDNPFATAIRGLLGLDQTTPEVEGLRRAVDGHASNAELKAAIAKVQEGRIRKQAEVKKLQDDLRQVITFEQEATLSLLHLLD